MTDVFISYKKEDVDRVRPIAEGLARAGFDVWWDHRIPPGRTYRDVIGAALQNSKCVMVVWSENSVRSQWVLDEADVGAQRRVLMPVLIDNIMPPLGFTQIEASRLMDWDGSDEQLEWKHTLEAVGELVGRAPGEAPPVQISMASSAGATDSAAILRATPGALSDMTDAVATPKPPADEGKTGKGGRAGALVAALLLFAALGGGAFLFMAGNSFSTSTPPETSVAAEETASLARVQLHLSDASQADLGQQVAEVLREAGHEIEDYVPEQGDRSPTSANQVRYFRDSAEPLAQSIADTLNRRAGLPAFRISRITGLETFEPADDIEIWLQRVETESDAAPASRFGAVNGRNVNTVTMPDGMVFTRIQDGRWAQIYRGRLEVFMRETQRTDWSVFLRINGSDDPLEIDLFMGTVFSDPYTKKSPLYTISSASVDRGSLD